MRQLISKPISKSIVLLLILLISSSLITCIRTLKPIGVEVIMDTFRLWIAPEKEYFSYIGEVKNTGHSLAYDVVVRIEVFYNDGNLFKIKVVSTNPPDIEPNTNGKWRIDYKGADPEANKQDIRLADLIDFDKTRYEIFWE